MLLLICQALWCLNLPVNLTPIDGIGCRTTAAVEVGPFTASLRSFPEPHRARTLIFTVIKSGFATLMPMWPFTMLHPKVKH